MNICKLVLKLEPENESAWNRVAIIYFHRGDIEDAIKTCKKSLELNPKYKYGWVSLGYINAAMGKKEEASEAYNKALEIDPNFEQAIELRKELTTSNPISNNRK